jgi:outer membrane protein assembly factor BamD
MTLTVGVCLLSSGCLFFGHKKPQPLKNESAAPDKILYDRAMDDIKHGRYTVARLTLQTLINTYPDSEYLAKAKLAMADSYFREGGISGLTQAVAEYKDFITFFPFLDEAAYAQYQVAMAHYRMMEKPDRDRTQALEAEAEFQTFLLKYPNSPLAEQAAQRLREVQEILAEGAFRTARFYYLRGAYGAAAARLLELTGRYPLYSRADEANWMLAEIYEKTEHRDFAVRFYQKIVREYPLSELSASARRRLAALGAVIPEPDPAALARMQAERRYDRVRPGILKRSLGILRSGPDVSMAAHYGQPNLTPPNNVVTAREVLSPAVIEGAVGASAATGTVSLAGVSAPASAGTTDAPGASASPQRADPQKPAIQDQGQTSASATAEAKGTPAASDTPSDEHSSGKKKKKKGFRRLIPW